MGKKFFKNLATKFIASINSSSSWLIIFHQIQFFSTRNLISPLRCFLNIVTSFLFFFFRRERLIFKARWQKKIVTKFLPNSRNHFYPPWYSLFSISLYLICVHMIDSTNSDNTHVTGGGSTNLIRWQFTITASRRTRCRSHVILRRTRTRCAVKQHIKVEK